MGPGRWWARRCARRREEALARLQAVPFGKVLFRHGVYVLPCGGGVISEPRRAISELEYPYGREGLIREARRFLFEPTEDEPTPEGTWGTAMGILYHLGTEQTYARLVSEWEGWLAEGDTTRAESAQRLIQGLARRLGLPLPEGIEPLSALDETLLFQQEM